MSTKTNQRLCPETETIIIIYHYLSFPSLPHCKLSFNIKFLPISCKGLQGNEKGKFVLFFLVVSNLSHFAYERTFPSPFSQQKSMTSVFLSKINICLL